MVEVTLGWVMSDLAVAQLNTALLQSRHSEMCLRTLLS